MSERDNKVETEKRSRKKLSEKGQGGKKMKCKSQTHLENPMQMKTSAEKTSQIKAHPENAPFPKNQRRKGEQSRAMKGTAKSAKFWVKKKKKRGTELGPTKSKKGAKSAAKGPNQKKRLREDFTDSEGNNSTTQREGGMERDF